MNNDLISREYVKLFVCEFEKYNGKETEIVKAVPIIAIDNAPTICGNNPKWCENCVSRGKCASTRQKETNNAELFKQTFGIYATELWSMSERNFLEWLNMEVKNDG